MAFQNHEGQVRSFQMPAYFWYRRAERSREEGQPVRALSLLRHAAQEEPEEREWRLEYGKAFGTRDSLFGSYERGVEFRVRFKFMFYSLGKPHDLLESSSVLLHQEGRATFRGYERMPGRRLL